MKRPSFIMGANTRLLRQRLAKMEVGDEVTYAQLSAEISSPVSGATPALNSARRSLLKTERMVFAPIHGQGLKRLGDEDIVKYAGNDVDSIRRKARKGVEKITSIGDYAAMDPKLQLAHTMRLSTLAAITDMTSSSGQKRLKKAAAGRASELPVKETLLAFMK